MNVDDLEELGYQCSKEGILVVAISSKWCKACETLNLILERFKEKGLIDIIHIDIDKTPYITRFVSLTAVPALIFLRDGEQVRKDIQVNGFPFVKNGIMIGINCESILEDLIDQI